MATTLTTIDRAAFMDAMKERGFELTFKGWVYEFPCQVDTEKIILIVNFWIEKDDIKTLYAENVNITAANVGKYGEEKDGGKSVTLTYTKPHSMKELLELINRKKIVVATYCYERVMHNL